MDKGRTLVWYLEYLMQDLHQLRTTDTHSFLTTLMWHIQILNLLSVNSGGLKKVESEIISLLKMSKAAFGDQK